MTTFDLASAIASIKHGERARRSILAGTARELRESSTKTTIDRKREQYLSTRGKRADGSPDWDALALWSDMSRFAAYVRSARMSGATATTTATTISTTAADRTDGLNLGMLAYDVHDILADAVEIALHWSRSLERNPDTPEIIHPALARRLAIKRERERAAAHGLDPNEVMPFTLGEMYRAIRSAYKRGLNVFGYWKGGNSIATIAGAGIKLTPTESAKWSRIMEREQQREQREQREREAALVAAGWRVERRTLDPERENRLAALVECYPAGAQRMPLIFAQALVAGHTIGEVLDAIERQTGKRPAEATLTRWAARLSELTGSGYRNRGAAVVPQLPRALREAREYAADQDAIYEHGDEARIRRYIAYQRHKGNRVRMTPAAA